MVNLALCQKSVTPNDSPFTAPEVLHTPWCAGQGASAVREVPTSRFLPRFLLLLAFREKAVRCRGGIFKGPALLHLDETLCFVERVATRLDHERYSRPPRVQEQVLPKGAEEEIQDALLRQEEVSRRLLLRWTASRLDQGCRGRLPGSGV